MLCLTRWQGAPRGVTSRGTGVLPCRYDRVVSPCGDTASQYQTDVDAKDASPAPATRLQRGGAGASRDLLKMRQKFESCRAYSGELRSLRGFQFSVSPRADRVRQPIRTVELSSCSAPATQSIRPDRAYQLPALRSSVIWPHVGRSSKAVQYEVGRWKLALSHGFIFIPASLLSACPGFRMPPLLYPAGRGRALLGSRPRPA